MNLKNYLSAELLKIITKSVEQKIYGSVEVYFEEGRITQITQRIISKVNKQNEVVTSSKKTSSPNPQQQISAGSIAR